MIEYQTTLEGVEPRPSQTEYGAMVLAMRERFGFARTLKVAHWIKYGEELAVERAKGIRDTREAA